MIRSAIGLLLVPVAMVIAAGTAEAAVVSGSNLAAKANVGICTEPVVTTSCTLAINSIPAANRAPGGDLAGMSGVIVGWTVRAGAYPEESGVRLRVVRGTEGAGRGALEMLPKEAGTYTFPARLPVSAGEKVGLDTYENAPLNPRWLMRSEVPGASTNFWIAPLADGQDVPGDVAAELELLMNVTIEPDSDHDGFGDETQDQCPKNPEATVPPCGVACPASNSGCGPPPSLPRAPLARITSGPKGTVHSHRVKFGFVSVPAGASFECKLDRRPMKPCRSPKAYRHLAIGKHTFKVRAVGASGVRRSPVFAMRSFRVEP